MQEKESQKAQLESALLQCILYILQEPEVNRSVIPNIPTLIDTLMKLWGADSSKEAQNQQNSISFKSTVTLGDDTKPEDIQQMLQKMQEQMTAEAPVDQFLCYCVKKRDIRNLAEEVAGEIAQRIKLPPLSSQASSDIPES